MLPKKPTHTNQPTFQNLPLLPGYTYNEAYLKRSLEVITGALVPVNRVFAVRLDLRFPQFYGAWDGNCLNNDYLRHFFKGLEQRLELDGRDTKQQGKRAHPPYLQYLWAREYNEDETRPHFHIVILLNRAAYRSLGVFSPGSKMLMTRVVEAWAGALGLHPWGGAGLVHVPENACYNLERDAGRGLPELFARVSYLCKKESKRPDGFHSFGSSRR